MATLRLRKPTKRKLTFPDRQAAFERQQQDERRQKLKLAHDWLKQFPAFQGKPVPLKIGIHADLEELRRDQKQPFGRQHLNAAIARHCLRPAYRRTLRDEAERYDVHRKSCGLVETQKATESKSQCEPNS